MASNLAKLEAVAKMDLDDDEVLFHLSHRPPQLLKSVISVDESSEYTGLLFATVNSEIDSALGRLDKLPLEVLHECLKHLDVISLENFGHVSRRGKVVAGSLSSFRILAKTAGYSFRVLAQAKVLHRHSIYTLYETLRLQNCVSCGAFGGFLSILEAKRCCWLCLKYNSRHWMITFAIAKQCFGFTDNQLNQLPSIQSIPGEYGMIQRRRRSFKLTTVAAAMQLALEVHGSMETIATKFPLGGVPTARRRRLLHWIRQAPLSCLPQNPLTIKEPDRPAVDAYFGMGAIPFPSSCRAQEIEWGHWCRGCEFSLTNQHYSPEAHQAALALVPKDCSPYVFLGKLQYQAWSTTDFLEHAKSCPSAKAFFRKNGFPSFIISHNGADRVSM